MTISRQQLIEGFTVLKSHQIYNPCEKDSQEYILWGMGFILGLYDERLTKDVTPAEYEGYKYAQSLNQSGT